MRGALTRDIELAGFVITPDEWAQMDRTQRAQLVRAATRRDEPWTAPAPPTRFRPAPPANDAYEVYELILAPA